MAYVKGGDAAGGGSNVNKAWVNKVAEEKWAAEQEEKRRKEREEDARVQRQAAESARQAEAQKQEQLAARKREQEQAAAQKAAQEEAARKAAQEEAARSAEAQRQEQLAARQRAAEQAAAQKAAQEQAARENAARQAEAQRQEQLAARQREAEEAAALAKKQEELRAQREAEQRAAQERAKAEAYARAQQEAAAKAAAERARQAQEQAQREAAAQRAAQLADQQRQRDAETKAAAGTSGKSSSNTDAGLSYSGAGAASPATEALESQWFDNTTPTDGNLSTTVPAAAAETPATSRPQNIYEATRNPRRSGEYRAEAQAPIVYTGGTTTRGTTTETRRTAANTKAALTGEESGMSEEQLAWLQTPEGQAALANQQAKKANDETLRNAALNTGISFRGQPITQDKRLSGQPMSAEEAANLAAVNSSIAAANAARNYRDGTPGNQRYDARQGGTTTQPITWGGAAQPAAGSGATRETGLPNPQVINRNQESGSGSQGAGGVTTPTLGQVLQGMADDFLLGRNGGTNPGNEVIDNYRNGTPGNQRYDARYPRATTAEQEAYIYDPNTGPTLPETPSFGDVLTEMMGRNGTERTGTAQDLTYGNYVPPSQSYEGQDIINPNVGRNSSGEWKAIQQEDKYIREGYAEAQKMSGWTERDRRDYAMYYAEQKKAEDAQKPTRERTWQEELRARREGKENGRPGAANALDEIMNGTYNGNAAGTGSQYDERTQAIIDRAREAGLTWSGGNAPGASGRTVSGENTMGIGSSSQSGTESGSGRTSRNSGASGSTARRSGEERAEQNFTKGTKFKPSYGQPMDQGVKLPYKAGGYTAADIEAAGNKARSDQKYYNGNKAYEGYYLAPDGRYYPIDQEKAAYYKANGNSYKGWEEPMREYYQTFGTYYGYRPDWKTAGGKNVWKANNNVAQNYRAPKSSSSTPTATPTATQRLRLSGNSYNGYGSYGRGSTVNNGLYYNPNTRWNI